MLATAIASVVMTSGSPDFLLDPRPFTARVSRSEREVAVDNGLIRRAWRTAPNLATVALDREGVSLLRAVGPEATVTLDGKTYAVGGLSGQPNRAFLSKTWLDGLVADPAAFQFIGVSEGPIQERFAWKRVRHAAPDAQWPPKGKELIFEFRAGVVDGELQHRESYVLHLRRGRFPSVDDVVALEGEHRVPFSHHEHPGIRQVEVVGERVCDLFADIASLVDVEQGFPEPLAVGVGGVQFVNGVRIDLRVSEPLRERLGRLVGSGYGDFPVRGYQTLTSCFASISRLLGVSSSPRCSNCSITSACPYSLRPVKVSSES